MNKKQTIVMWLGIVVTVLIVLFPPNYHHDYSISLLELSTNEIYFVPLFLLIFCVALVTAGLIYTLRDKKPKDEQAE